MDEITTDMAREWLYGPQKSGERWARNTMLAARAACMRVWRYVMDREAELVAAGGGMPTVVTNPFQKIKVEKPTSSAVGLSKEGWHELLEAIRGTPYALWMGMAYLAGLRQAAVSRHDHWNLETGKLHVAGTKTKRAKGDIPLPPLLAELYREHCEAGYAGRTFVFVGAGRGEAIHSSTAALWAKEAYERAGLKYGRDVEGGLTYHSGRHSFATWLAQDNVSPVIIAKLVGDTVQVVVDTYIKLRDDDLVFAMEGLQRALEETRSVPQSVPQY